LSECRIKEIKHRQLLAGIKGKHHLYQHLNAVLRWIIPLIRRDGPIAKLEIGSQLQIGVTSRELISFPPTFTDASLSANMIKLMLQIGLRKLRFSVILKINLFTREVSKNRIQVRFPADYNLVHEF
jgi:hypothetical protein